VKTRNIVISCIYLEITWRENVQQTIKQEQSGFKSSYGFLAMNTRVDNSDYNTKITLGMETEQKCNKN